MNDKNKSNEMALESPNYMATESYAESNADLIIAYAKLRVHGIHASVAFRRLWGEEFWDSYSQARIYAIESTEVYIHNFRDILLKTPIQELWNDKLSVHKLLSLANNIFEKGSTQLRAIQELNVLVGITIVDENGKTRKGSNMSDFYKDIGTENRRGLSDEKANVD